ncbi:MAG: hypothetical protein AAGF25_11920 [Pseudomonadota bacterium]
MRLVHAFLLLSTVVLFAGQAHAACITAAPNGSSLEIYGDPLDSRPVIGGVSVGQCTLEVTPTCSGDFCQVFLGTLSGWADMRFVDVDPSEQTNSSFEYEIVGGGGTITFLGRTQPAPVTPGGRVVFTLLDDATMRLTLPRESQMSDIIMQRTGSSSFTGAMSDWGGFPVRIEVIAEPVSAPRAILDFISNDPKVKMEMSMELNRTNNPRLKTKLSQAQATNKQQPNEKPNGSNGAHCLLVSDVSAAMGIEERNAASGVYQNILDRVGLDLRSASDDQCQAVLDAALNEGVLCELVNTVGLPPNFSWGPVQINANGGTVNRIPAKFCPLSQAQGRGKPVTTKIKESGAASTPAQTPQNGITEPSVALCEVVSTAIGPILREGNSSNRRNQLMDVLRSVGIFDLTAASTGECRQIGIDLVRVGLIAEGAIDLSGSAIQGGEDPSTMIEGGVEIPGSDQDFAPIGSNSNQQASASSSAQSVAPMVSGSPSACVAFADQVLTIIGRGNAVDVSILQIILSNSGMTQISDRSELQCSEAASMLSQRGLVK